MAMAETFRHAYRANICKMVFQSRFPCLTQSESDNAERNEHFVHYSLFYVLRAAIRNSMPSSYLFIPEPSEMVLVSASFEPEETIFDPGRDEIEKGNRSYNYRYAGVALNVSQKVTSIKVKLQYKPDAA